jgi:preprotein translocase subunit SecG
MIIFIILFTTVMVLDCLFLILLVLMQLPKKEAGMGLAFGGAATDALFGAGSGNFLTKATKYAAIVFFATAILVSVLYNIHSRQSGSEFRRQMQQGQQAPITVPATAPSTAPGTTPAVPAVGSSTNTLLLPVEAASTNSAPATAPQK